MVMKKYLARAALLLCLAAFVTSSADANVVRHNTTPNSVLTVHVKTTHYVYNWWYNDFVYDYDYTDTYYLNYGESVEFYDQYNESDYTIYSEV